MKPAFQPINERCTPETISVEARGLELVQRVTGYYNSTDPLVLAARAGITVAYERWPLITVGSTTGARV